MTTDELLAENVRLTEQLRRVYEAVDTAENLRRAAPGDYQWRTMHEPVGDTPIEVLIDDEWYSAHEAILLTRAALHAIDARLEEAGVL